MKWLPSKGSQKQNLEGQLPSQRQLPKFTPFVFVGLIALLATAGVFVSANAYKFKSVFRPDSSQGLIKEIDRVAADISVKILDREFLGSGFVVQQSGNQYTVITNQHVLRAGEAPYRIQTPDGKIHVAEVIADSFQEEYEYDLAVLQFKAKTNYSVAQIGSSLYLEVGEPIFAAGFPYTEIESKTASQYANSNSRINKTTGLTLTAGRIAIILNQALIEGYQIGYTNDVRKGMSGGPLLNSRGEVVGVNGKHAYPLWESPELYQDGSQPCPALEKLITRSSLAIPIEKSIELNPQLKSLKTTSDVEVTRRSNLLSEDPELVAQMQEEAAFTAQSCQQYGADLTDDFFEGELKIETEQ